MIIINICEDDLEVYSMIAKNMRKYKELNDISTDELAEFTGLDKNHLEDILTGKYEISIMELYTISEVLGVTIDNFFDS